MLRQQHTRHLSQHARHLPQRASPHAPSSALSGRQHTLLGRRQTPATTRRGWSGATAQPSQPTAHRAELLGFLLKLRLGEDRLYRLERGKVHREPRWRCALAAQTHIEDAPARRRRLATGLALRGVEAHFRRCALLRSAACRVQVSAQGPRACIARPRRAHVLRTPSLVRISTADPASAACEPRRQRRWGLGFAAAPPQAQPAQAPACGTTQARPQPV